MAHGGAMFRRFNKRYRDMEQKKQTKKRITELYHFMSDAKMQKLKDDEKIALIKLLRTMKPIAVEVMDALHEAADKAAE